MADGHRPLANLRFLRYGKVLTQFLALSSSFAEAMAFFFGVVISRCLAECVSSKECRLPQDAECRRGGISDAVPPE